MIGNLKKYFKHSVILIRSLRRKIACIIIISTIFLLSSCLVNNALKSKTLNSISFFALDTLNKIEVYGADDDFLDELKLLVESYEKTFSRTIKDSEISKINKGNGKPVKLSPDAKELIQTAFEYSKISDGAFDITIAPVSSLWDFSDKDSIPPTDKQISDAISNVGYEKAILKGDYLTMREGMMLDAGSIAKGFIADKIRDRIISGGYTSALINLGGNVQCVGTKPDGEKWSIGLQGPFENRTEIIGMVAVSDMSVVCSAIYERYFIYDEKLYHHLLDPGTGYPIQNNLEAVTIVATNSMDADALTTACFILGYEKAEKLIESIEYAEAVFVFDDGSIKLTSGFGNNPDQIPIELFPKD